MSERPVDREPHPAIAYLRDESRKKSWSRLSECADVLEASEARVVLLEAQRDDLSNLATDAISWAPFEIEGVQVKDALTARRDEILGRAAVSVADSGPEEKKP